MSRLESAPRFTLGAAEVIEANTPTLAQKMTKVLPAAHNLTLSLLPITRLPPARQMSHGYRACDASACQALATGNFYNLAARVVTQMAASRSALTITGMQTPTHWRL